MKKQNIVSLVAISFGMLFVLSCKTQKKSTTEACTSPSPTYSANVKSIIESKCAVEGCHARGKGDFRVFENFKREVDAGEVNEKVIVQKSMPPNSKLADSEIKLIDCWMKDGGKEN